MHDMAAPCTPLGRVAAEVRVVWDREALPPQDARAWLASIGPAEKRAYLRSVYGDAAAPPQTRHVDLRALRWFWWWAPGAERLARLECPVWRALRPGDIWVPGLALERHLAFAGFFVEPVAAAAAAATAAAATMLQPHSTDVAAGPLFEVMRIAYPARGRPRGPEEAASNQTCDARLLSPSLITRMCVITTRVRRLAGPSGGTGTRQAAASTGGRAGCSRPPTGASCSPPSVPSLHRDGFASPSRCGVCGYRAAFVPRCAKAAASSMPTASSMTCWRGATRPRRDGVQHRCPDCATRCARPGMIRWRSHTPSALSATSSSIAVDRRRRARA